MRTLNVYSTLFWLGFAAYVAVESCRLGLGDWRRPGPGYFPFGSALVLALFSILALIKSLRTSPSATIKSGGSQAGWRNVALVMAGLIGYVALINTLGFVVCTFLLVTLFRVTMTPGRWLNTILIALCVSLGFHLLFNVLLNAQLPKGWLNI